MAALLEEIELILPIYDPDDIQLTGNVLLGNEWTDLHVWQVATGHFESRVGDL